MTSVVTSALLAASSAIGAETTCPPGEPCVVVTIVGDTDQVLEFSLADFDGAAAIRTNQTYDYRGSPSTNYPSLLPVRDLLDQLGTPPGAVSFVEVGASTAAPSSTLLGDDGDLDDPGPFSGGQIPSIYTVTGADGQRFGYTRGQRGGSDTNGDDTIVTTGDLKLTVHTTGKPLRPVVTASPQTQPTANLPVTFSVAVEDAPGLRYDWAFGDGTTLDDSSDATPTHQYLRSATATGQDSYVARVTVTGSDSSTGSSRPVTVTIGSPAPGTGEKPGTGSAPNADAPATGPDRSKGDTAGAAPSEKSGGTGNSAGAAAPQAPVSGDVPLASVPPETAAVGDGLVAVDGILLGTVDTAGQIVPAPEQVAAERTAAAARQAALQHRSPPWALVTGGLALTALLGFGALTETGWWRRLITRITRRPTA